MSKAYFHVQNVALGAIHLVWGGLQTCGQVYCTGDMRLVWGGVGATLTKQVAKACTAAIHTKAFALPFPEFQLVRQLNSVIAVAVDRSFYSSYICQGV